MSLRRLTLVVLSLAACRGRSDAPSRAATRPAGPIRLVANEYAFASLPDTVHSGWHEFMVVNQGTQPHMAVIARLDGGKTFSDYLAGVKANTPMPWLREVGGVNAVLPGDSLVIAADLPAGRYIASCYVADSTGILHVLKGMASTFTVATSGAGVPAIAEPTGDDTVHLTSYRIAFASPPVSGRHIFRVEDVDSIDANHDLVIVRLQEGKTPQDVMTWLTSMRGAPPFSTAGATTGIEPGRHDYIHVNLTPGRYLALCFMPDHTDGKPHYMHGMTAAFTVGT